MVAYTDTVGFNKGSAQHSANTAKMYLMEVDLDFAAITTARAAASLTAFSTGDSLAVLQIPAKTYIVAVGIDVTTADGTASTVDLGYTGGDVDAWIDGHDANAVGSAGPSHVLTEGTPNVEIGHSFGRYHATADTIDLLMLTAPQDASVMRVWAICIDCS